MEINKYELAIKSAGMTKTEAKKIIGLRSYQAITERLNNPKTFRIAEIEKLAQNMPEQSKEILKEAVDEIFLS